MDFHMDVYDYIISIHVPQVGHDYTPAALQLAGRIFQSTCPRWGTTALCWQVRLPHRQFQSTCPRRGTTRLGRPCRSKIRISIHVPQVGHDISVRTSVAPPVDISIHVPQVGHDRRIIEKQRVHVHFNPRAPGGARPAALTNQCLRTGISIHVPQVGHDRISNRGDEIEI